MFCFLVSILVLACNSSFCIYCSFIYYFEVLNCVFSHCYYFSMSLLLSYFRIHVPVTLCWGVSHFTIKAIYHYFSAVSDFRITPCYESFLIVFTCAMCSAVFCSPPVSTVSSSPYCLCQIACFSSCEFLVFLAFWHLIKGYFSSEKKKKNLVDQGVL